MLKIQVCVLPVGGGDCLKKPELGDTGTQGLCHHAIINYRCDLLLPGRFVRAEM